MNGYIKISKSTKRVCQELREAMLTANAPEMNELVLSLHFWEEYLAKDGRENALTTFWKTRRGLVDKNKVFNADNSQQAGLGYTGILGQLKSILISPEDNDTQNLLLHSNFPLIIIQSTEDVFVSPHLALSTYSKENLLKYGRHIAKDNSSVLNPKSVQMNWIRGGHEIIQERSSYLLSVICNLAQLCGIETSENNISVAKTESYAVDSDVDDMVDLIKPSDLVFSIDDDKKSNPSLVDSWISIADSISGEVQTTNNSSDKHLQSPAKAPPSRQRSYLSSQSSTEESKSREELESERLQKQEKKEKDSEKRRLVVMDRRKREALEAKQQQIEIIKERQRQLAEERQEAKELTKMAKEDERSLFAEEYVHECEVAQNSAKIAKEKNLEIMEHRKEAARKIVADKLAQSRYARLQERKNQASKLAHELEHEDIVIKSEQENGYLASNKHCNQNIVHATFLALKEVMSYKVKLVDALKRQKLVEQQTLQYRNQKDKIESEIRKLRQAIQLINKNPLLQGLGMSKKESDELKNSLSQKEDTFREFALLGASREEQLESCNRSVVTLKNHYKYLESDLDEKIKQMESTEKSLSRVIRDLRLNIEGSLIKKDLINTNNKLVLRRIDILKVERERLKKHKAELIDSDVLNPGVLQRCVTKDLKRFLKQEYEKEKEKLMQNERDVNELLSNIESSTTIQEGVVLDYDRIFLALGMIKKTYHGVKMTSPVDMMNEILNKQDRAKKIEDKVNTENSNGNLDDISLENSTASTHLCQKVRGTETGLRSRDDRLFIAMDIQLYPEYYKSLSTTEMEEMKFDPGYKCDLDVTDLQRILKLPENVALAMPFLYTLEEVTFHRLINTYYRSKDENYFKKADFYEGMQNSMEKANNSIASDDWLMAQVTHDIMTKEILCDRLRSIGASDTITPEERLWMSMDRVLSPHLYDGGGEQFYCAKKIPVKTADSKVKLDGTTLLYAILPKNSLDVVVEGDRYEAERLKFENGEVSYSDSVNETICPFDRMQLLNLRSISNTSLELASPVEQLCHRLMDKYYIDPDESYFGLHRMKSINEISKALVKNENKHRKHSITSIVSSDAFEDNDGTSTIDDASSIDDGIKRIYGTFDHIHPASLGSASQKCYFLVSSYSALRDHPAAFAVREADNDANPFGLEIFNQSEISESISNMDDNSKRDFAINQLTAQPGNSKYGAGDASSALRYKSKFLIMDSIKDLARQEPRTVGGKIVLIVASDIKTILEIPSTELKSRQSRSHRFDVPELEDMHVLDFTVSIVYHGCFGQKGYKLGRLAAGLFRLSKSAVGDSTTSSNTTTSVPIPVGYAPYNLQHPNLPDALGRIVLTHSPQIKPIPAGSYQIVLGAASVTKYTIQVTCHYAKNAFNLVDSSFTEARLWQARLPICIAELEDLAVGLRLAERKLLVVSKMIMEAEVETRQVQQAITDVNNRLLRDDETMEYTEDERRELIREQGILDIEFAEWAMMYASRSREVEDIKAGIAMMHRLQREKQQEKSKLKSDLVDARRDIPSCFALLRSFQEASNVAISLNTSVQGKIAAVFAAQTQKDSRNVFDRLQTPAEAVRRKFRSEGFESLSLEEQKWSMMDQSLNAHHYEWLQEKVEEENQARIEMGKRPLKIKKYNAAVEAYR